MPRSSHSTGRSRPRSWPIRSSPRRPRTIRPGITRPCASPISSSTAGGADARSPRGHAPLGRRIILLRQPGRTASVPGRHRSRAVEIAAWAAVLDGEGNQQPHVHIDGYLSGCYYVTIPEEIADRRQWSRRCVILAASKRAGRREELGLKAASRRAQSSRKEGMMVLFPAYLYHATCRSARGSAGSRSPSTCCPTPAGRNAPSDPRGRSGRVRPVIRSPTARRKLRRCRCRHARVGWTRLVSRVQATPRSKSIHRPVPVKPVWPMVCRAGMVAARPAGMRAAPSPGCASAHRRADRGEIGGRGAVPSSSRAAKSSTPRPCRTGRHGRRAAEREGILVMHLAAQHAPAPGAGSVAAVRSGGSA